ncbi:maleylpyruvate isomerase family mycothiol-dependent enzyme [Nocardioides astragali]|uniref:Maleylpyruvate isomerase family mycothiol-dependent enzyme n=1 Tax=Nocardioides astragali TaxID=1776736 RepID=A0ABW2N5P7_9ACTN|nr:maleylpyruvate isomerase family mycothiol-dependent enzyme [Nocardioides astragali]
MSTASIPRAAQLPQTDPDTARDLAVAEYDALLAMVDAFEAPHWDLPTDCTEWRVREMVAHLAGAAEEACRLRVLLRHQAAALNGVRRREAMADALCAVQIADRAGLSDAELAADLRRWAAGAPDGRRRQPALLRRLPMPPFAGLRPGSTLAYVLDVIYLRDVWLHRVDLQRATVVEMPSSRAEGEVVAQVVRDLDLEWTGPAFTLELTGRAPGRWVVGAGEPVAVVVEDAVALMRLLSGRSDECVLVTDGDAALADRLRAARVVF